MKSIIFHYYRSRISSEKNKHRSQKTRKWFSTTADGWQSHSKTMYRRECSVTSEYHRYNSSS